MSSAVFSRVQREASLSEQVSRQIHEEIASGRLPLNGRLPAERDLAARFGVSRTVIREAVMGLAARGMVRVSHGRAGTLVCAPSPEAAVGMLSIYLGSDRLPGDPRDVIEARQVIEAACAGLAAARRNPADLAALNANVAEGNSAATQGERLVELDLNFHLLIARATHNRLFPVLLASIQALMLNVRLAAPEVPGAAIASTRQHRKILGAVDAGDEEGARAAMRRHIKTSEMALLKEARLAGRPATILPRNQSSQPAARRSKVEGRAARRES